MGSWGREFMGSGVRGVVGSWGRGVESSWGSLEVRTIRIFMSPGGA